VESRITQRFILCLILVALVTVTACRKAPSPTSEPTHEPIKVASQKSESELAPFQGAWKHLSIDVNGKQAAPAIVREYVYRFDGAQFSSTRSGQVQSKGTFVIHATKSPGWIDLVESPAITIYGIYRFDRDKLTLCLHEKQRPTTFEPPPGRGHIVLVLERDTPQLTDFPESSLTPAHTAAAKELQGKWKVTEFHTAQGSSVVEEGRLIPYTFDGNKLITVGPGDIGVEIEYRLDPTKSPQQIDQRFTGGRIGPWIAKGIYKVDGDKLTICYGNPNVARPTDFTATPGDGRTMRVHKRVK
jgi:uncharacterized protein (TIGR03067 family)